MSMIKKYCVICVGAGGTGSYFLSSFSRFIVGNKDVKDLVVIDGDFVEKKNLERQMLFSQEDVGRNKAVAAAEALSEVFELPWKGVGRYIKEPADIDALIPSHGYEKVIPVLIGACDNHAARKVMEEWFRGRDCAVYIDSANEMSAGSVVIALKNGNRKAGLLRSEYYPELFEGDMRSPDEMSCEEMNAVAPQHIATNMLAGCFTASVLMGLISDGHLATPEGKPGIVFFDRNTCAASFTPYTAWKAVKVPSKKRGVKRKGA